MREKCPGRKVAETLPQAKLRNRWPVFATFDEIHFSAMVRGGPEPITRLFVVAFAGN